MREKGTPRAHATSDCNTRPGLKLDKKFGVTECEQDKAQLRRPPVSRQKMRFVLAAHNETDHNTLMTSTFRKQLAEPRPFPGRGSAAAYVGDLALALVEKVVRLEMKRRQADTDAVGAWNGRLSRIANLSTRFQFLIQEDGRAYARMSSTRARVTDVDVVAEAVRESTMAPLEIIRGAIQGLSLISESSKDCRKHLVPDLQVSCDLLWAVARGAKAIALANIMLLESASNRTALHAALIEAFEDARDVHVATKAVLDEMSLAISGSGLAS